MPELEVNDNAVLTPSSVLENEENSENDPIKEDKEDIQREEWLDVLGSGDIKIKTIIEGQSGNRPQTGDVCTVTLFTELEDGTEIGKDSNLKVELGASEVIQGLDLVLSLLDLGQTATAIIKPRFAYGKLGLKPNIPPDATLIFTIELLKIDDAPEIGNLSFEERMQKAIFKKDKGNWWFSRDDAQKAIQCYRSGLDILQESTPFTDLDGKVTEMPEDVFREFVQAKLIIYNNLAAAQILIGAFDSALASADRVIQLEPNNVKALYRKGKIYSALGNCDEAVSALKKAISLDPDNNAVKKELATSLKRQALEKEQAKSLYKRMLGSQGQDKEQPIAARPSNPGGISAVTKVLGGAAAATIAAGLAYGLSYKLKAVSFWE